MLKLLYPMEFVESDWGVNKAADKLSRSLFGASPHLVSSAKKQSGKNQPTALQPDRPRPNSSYNNWNKDGDDERMSKKERKHLKEKQRKWRKKHGGGQTDDRGSINMYSSVENELRENKRVQVPASKEKKLKKNTTHLDRVTDDATGVSLKKRKWSKADFKNVDLHQTESETFTDMADDNSASTASRKRKKSKPDMSNADHKQNESAAKEFKRCKKRQVTELETGSDSPLQKMAKKAKLRGSNSLDKAKLKDRVHLESVEGSSATEGSPTQKAKRKRNRNKKNNSKKNKYKHLALNNKKQDTAAVENVSTREEKLPSTGVKSSNYAEKSPNKKIGKAKGAKLLESSESDMRLQCSTIGKNKKTKGGCVKNIPPKQQKNSNAALKQRQIEDDSNSNFDASEADEGSTEDFSNFDSDIEFGMSSDSDIDNEIIEKANSTQKPEGKNSSTAKESTEQNKNVKHKSVPVQSADTKPQKTMSLAEKARETLNSARFRFLNEQLYTSSGHEALQMFKKDKEAFEVYHRGYQAQVSRWPLNPLDIIMQQLRNKPDCKVIADFGCGDARLAETLTHKKVHSFDLVALKPCVTVCDIAKVPLESGTVDAAVFCLSLMGTNLSDFLSEANRVLKNRGMMKVAEVVSRFDNINAFVSQVERLGFQLLKKTMLSKMFYLFTFRKVKDTQRKLAPVIELQPCYYKRR